MCSYFYWAHSFFQNIADYVFEFINVENIKRLPKSFLPIVIAAIIIVSIFCLLLISFILCLLGIISTLSLFFLTLSALPFGLDAIFWSHFSQITVESTPPGLFDVYVHHSVNDKQIDKGFSLSHSLIYNENEVLFKIKSWL